MSQEPQDHGNNDLPVAVSKPRQAIHAHCPACDYTWFVIKLPCDLNKMGRLMKSVFCPHCHDDTRITLASDEQIARMGAK